MERLIHRAEAWLGQAEGHWPDKEELNRIAALVTEGKEMLRNFPKRPMTYEAYKRLEEGMSYKEVVKIIGFSGQEQSRVEFLGTETVLYAWTNLDGSNMIVTFQDGGLISKAQLGLK